MVLQHTNASRAYFDCKWIKVQIITTVHIYSYKVKKGTKGEHGPQQAVIAEAEPSSCCIMRHLLGISLSPLNRILKQVHGRVVPSAVCCQ